MPWLDGCKSAAAQTLQGAEENDLPRLVAMPQRPELSVKMAMDRRK